MNHDTIHLKDHFSFLGENGCDPTLRLYLLRQMVEMEGQDDFRPTILICPGGGYSIVSEREAEPVAMQFLAKGYNVVILIYSCKPNTFPTQIREVAAAVELIHQNAALWHCDPNRIAIMGFSAGGHLAAHYSTCYDCEEVREVFPESKPVNASMLCYPVITGFPPYHHCGSIQNVSGHEQLTESDMIKFSADMHVTDVTPPAFLWHTSEDSDVPVMNSLLYAQALAQHKIPFALHVYPYGGHGLSTVDSFTNTYLKPNWLHAGDWVEAAQKWLKLTF